MRNEEELPKSRKGMVTDRGGKEVNKYVLHQEKLSKAAIHALVLLTGQAGILGVGHEALGLERRWDKK
jgi:hypothetical protein